MKNKYKMIGIVKGGFIQIKDKGTIYFFRLNSSDSKDKEREIEAIKKHNSFAWLKKQGYKLAYIIGRQTEIIHGKIKCEPTLCWEL